MFLGKLTELFIVNEGYHEPIEELTDATRNMHRAITSLMEELEAVDWYNQRVDACKDAELRPILEHNLMKRGNMLRWCWSGFGVKTRGWMKS